MGVVLNIFGQLVFVSDVGHARKKSRKLDALLFGHFHEEQVQQPVDGLSLLDGGDLWVGENFLEFVIK